MVEDPVRRQRYAFRPLEDDGVELDLEVDPGARMAERRGLE